MATTEQLRREALDAVMRKIAHYEGELLKLYKARRIIEDEPPAITPIDPVAALESRPDLLVLNVPDLGQYRAEFAREMQSTADRMASNYLFSETCHE